MQLQQIASLGVNFKPVKRIKGIPSCEPFYMTQFKKRASASISNMEITPKQPKNMTNKIG